MAKQRKVFSCIKCGYQSPQWLGNCPGCKEWNSFEEDIFIPENQRHPEKKKADQSQKIGDTKEENYVRTTSGIHEFDRVLGGGLVEGSLVLIGGEPGIGKSTLLIDAVGKIAKNNPNDNVLYVSGEESTRQIATRAKRLGIDADNLYLYNETTWENILVEISKIKPKFLVIDSIQTTGSREVPSVPGTVSQIREVAHRLMNYGKTEGVACLIVGHITKDGNIAGPKILEHMVDTVIYFEGDRHSYYRLLRSMKNRFGNTNEVGIFEMEDGGLKEVPNPSQYFLEDNVTGSFGRSLSCIIEGTRVLFIELQSLVVENKFGGGKRVTQGFDKNRLELLVAVVEKYLQVPLNFQDIYFNVIGGIRLTSRETDLCVTASILSSYHGKSVGNDVIFLGEVGLTGEVRSTPRTEIRLKEMEHLGYKKLVTSKYIAKTYTKKFQNIDIIGVRSVAELNQFFMP